MEQAVSHDIVEGLRARGHEVEVLKDSTSFGRGEMILRMASGSLAGATEPRTDGCVAVW